MHGSMKIKILKNKRILLLDSEAKRATTSAEPRVYLGIPLTRVNVNLD